MNYLALYRKYRPTTLEEMVGQAEIKAILSSSVVNDTISHAYLFSGPRGTGKTSTAKIFARMVNCEHFENGVPCGSCDSCLAVINNTDVVEIDAASNNGVDEIRDLREKANLVPSICRYKVYIIDEVHMLTTQAFNALLKTLEEPPKHVIFILATTEYHKVPLTITSRCQKFQFSKLQVDENVRKLREISDNENISITDEALYEIAKISDGGMRDSINFLDQLRSFKNGVISRDDVFEVCGNVSNEEIVSLFINLKRNMVSEVANYLEDIGNKGKSYGKFLEDVLAFCRDVLLYKNDVDNSLVKADKELVDKVLEVYLEKEIYLIVDVINELLEKIKYTSRQAVVVVIEFLSIINKLSSGVNNIDENLNFKQDSVLEDKYELAFNITSSEKEKNGKSTNSDLQMCNNDVEKNINKYLKNKEIIVNNALALADKSLKVSLQSKWASISDYLIDNKFSVVASKLADTVLEVAGKEYVIFTVDYESAISNIYNNYHLCMAFIEKLFGGKYNFVFITRDEWNKYREKYINDYKSGTKYEVKPLLTESVDEEELNDKSSNTIVDKLFELVGEDCVEIK